MAKERRLLRVLRVQQEPKVSQSQLAKKAGMGLYRYWQIENGEGPTSTPAEREAVATSLNAKVSDIAWPEYEREATA